MNSGQYDEKLRLYFENHRAELLRDTEKLVNINSELTEECEGMPFGEGVSMCMQAAYDMMRSYGFETKDYDGYAVSGDLGDGERGLDILAHLDVVPAGEGWTVTEPFRMKISDGRIYGRGTADDKGPAICALYAMRAIKELEIPLAKSVRLILGGDEETESRDLDYYYENEKPAPMSFSPDADYPLIYIEKGGLHSGFTSNAKIAKKLPRVTYIHGGEKLNVVPERAEAVIEGIATEDIKNAIKEINADVCNDISYQINTENESIRITAKGVTAHASTPEAGSNALTGLLTLLAKLPLSDEAVHHQICEIAKMFPHGDYYGKSIGVAIEDAESGKTTLSFNRMDLSENGMEGMFDCRASIAANDDNMTYVIRKKFAEAGLIPMEDTMYPPHHVDRDSEIVTKLLKAYCDVTGEAAEPIAMGGGTYVHGIENGVAFGCAVEGVDNHMHGADEFMEIDLMMKSCLIFAKAIISICGIDAE